jgi:hypothetical protein
MVFIGVIFYRHLPVSKPVWETNCWFRYEQQRTPPYSTSNYQEYIKLLVNQGDYYSGCL